MSATYSVPAVHCGHCVAAITGEVSKLAEVNSVTVDLESKTVTVDGNADADAVIAAIDEAGYEVADGNAPKSLPLI